MNGILWKIKQIMQQENAVNFLVAQIYKMNFQECFSAHLCM
jgi:hypothetical protein